MERAEALELKEAYQKQWRKKLLLAGSNIKKLAEQIDMYAGKNGADYQQVPEIIKAFKNDSAKVPSEFMRKYYKKLVEIFVSKEHLEDYYRIIDKLTEFPYSRGMWRRTVRSRYYAPWFQTVFELLNSYKMLSFYNCSVYDFISNNMPDEMVQIKNNYWYDFKVLRLDLIIAARIDGQDEKLISLIYDMILGDNNTAVVSVEVIRGIIMSSNDELHKLLADFLLAARLQEGVRQVICENADCGTTQAFIRIFNTIYDNNLIRFASVKRAVAVWTGLCDLENADRISGKVLQSVHDVLNCFPDKAAEYTKSNDSILIMCGLWAYGFFDVSDAVSVMDGYLREGSRNQLLTMGYYNSMLQFNDYAYRTAAKVVRTFPEDYELIAVFMPSFLNTASDYAFKAVNRRYGIGNGEKPVYKRVPVEYLYPNREEAYEFYDIMKNIYHQIPKKRLEFNPVVFPWYSAYISKTQLVIRMCVTAYALEDNTLIDDACGYISSIDTTENYANRSVYLELLTFRAETAVQRRTLIEAVADKETYTRKTAFRMVKELELNEEEYILLESFLKYKTSDIRKQVLELLNMQTYDKRLNSAKRLLSADKPELRTGGLSILQDIKQSKEAMADSSVKKTFDAVVEGLQELPKITDSEQVIIEELSGMGKASGILSGEGYGLYNPEPACVMPKREQHPEVFRRYLDISSGRLDDAFEKLERFYKEHEMLEYKTAYGAETLLSNGLSPITYDTGLPIQDRYPFKELWIEFYETYIKEPALLMYMQIALWLLENEKLENHKVYNKYINELLGSVLSSYRPELGKTRTTKNDYKYNNAIGTVISIMGNIYPDPAFRSVSKEILNYIVYNVNDDALWYKTVQEDNQNRAYYYSRKDEVSLLSSNRMDRIAGLFKWSNDAEFKEWFAVFYDIDRRFQNNAHNKKLGGYYGNPQNKNKLCIFDYVKAYTLGLIPENEIYKAAFEYYSLEYTLDSLSMLLLDKLMPYQEKQLKAYIENREINEKSYFYQKAVEVYRRIMAKVLDVELSRGDLPTVFSKGVSKVKRFYGMDRMVQILVALGKEKLDRRTYYFGSDGDSKKVVLSHLLSVCYPNPEDNAEELSKLLENKNISESRLFETMMYAPQWIDIIQEYLGKELKSGCYYFMAHMNERFDDKKKAVIAKYTPLSEEELNNGAFDLQWFESAYNSLGEEIFDRLYDAAKYISDGSKHSRARKYADAALGRVTVESLETEIKAKRNKDLLMSYGIVPIIDETDLLHRYEFIQEFRKESRQFGAQRKASEGIACDMAMKNLATNAGFQDVTRLVLAMETKLVENDRDVFEDHMIEGVEVKLSVDDYGRAELVCVKNGKTLKSIPAALKKNEYIINLKEFQKKLKEQYSRTVKMFEQAMENRELYELKELKALTGNPVIAPIVKSLVYVACELPCSVIGMLSENGLCDYNRQLTELPENTKLRVAHPFDMHQAGCWSEYQNYLFEEINAGTIVKQPFKQVFRELYVKLDEEKDEYATRMFAGNQIQPQKTVGCLKNRHWVADYEEGLQKVYYKDNIIAKMYALADWFSPSDIEAPTLEWVEFSDRNTFRTIKLKEVPDIIYSEIMRDVDLAVSVAHVGGVDPETSHSTMDMRKVIISHNLPLFKLTNVTFEGHHAIIQGELGRYSIHLGSGNIHMIGGHQINVLPVHSQSRGKLFLPFVDEDPKTAEIMSKIVLFAQDKKIKDPYILSQMH